MAAALLARGVRAGLHELGGDPGAPSGGGDPEAEQLGHLLVVLLALVAGLAHAGDPDRGPLLLGEQALAAPHPVAPEVFLVGAFLVDGGHEGLG